MDEPVITAQEIQERTAPDPANVAALAARAMAMRSAWKPRRLHAIPLDVGATSDQSSVSSPSAISPLVVGSTPPQ